jgi:hypothetical protein
MKGSPLRSYKRLAPMVLVCLIMSPSATVRDKEPIAAVKFDREGMVKVRVPRGAIDTTLSDVCLIQRTSASQVIFANDNLSQPISRSLCNWVQSNVKGYFPETQNAHHEKWRPGNA